MQKSHVAGYPLRCFWLQKRSSPYTAAGDEIRETVRPYELAAGPRAMYALDLRFAVAF